LAALKDAAAVEDAAAAAADDTEYDEEADIHRENRHEGATIAPIEMGKTSPSGVFAADGW